MAKNNTNNNTKELEIKVAEATGAFIQAENEKKNLQNKLKEITAIVAEAFDQDGVDDIKLPTGNVNIFFWILGNFKSIYDLIRKIVEALRNPTPETIVEDEILTLAPTPTNK